jgi:hypothetical protein
VPTVAEDDDAPKQCQQGNISGKTKLFDLQQVVLKKEQEL